MHKVLRFPPAVALLAICVVSACKSQAPAPSTVASPAATTATAVAAQPPLHALAAAPANATAALWIDDLSATLGDMNAFVANACGDDLQKLFAAQAGKLPLDPRVPNDWQRAGIDLTAGAAAFFEVPHQAPVVALGLHDAGALAKAFEQAVQAAGQTVEEQTLPVGGTTLHILGRGRHGQAHPPFVHWAQVGRLVLLGPGGNPNALQAAVERLEGDAEALRGGVPRLAQQPNWQRGEAELAAGLVAPNRGLRAFLTARALMDNWSQPLPPAVASIPDVHAAWVLDGNGMRSEATWPTQTGNPGIDWATLLHLADRQPAEALVALFGGGYVAQLDAADVAHGVRTFSLGAWRAPQPTNAPQKGVAAALPSLRFSAEIDGLPSRTYDPFASFAKLAEGRLHWPTRKRQLKIGGHRVAVIELAAKPHQTVPYPIALGHFDKVWLLAMGQESLVTSLRQLHPKPHSGYSATLQGSPAMRALHSPEQHISTLLHLRLDRLLAALLPPGGRGAGRSPLPQAAKLGELASVFFDAGAYHHGRFVLTLRADPPPG